MESSYNYWLLDHLEVRVFVADVVTIDETWRFRNAPLGHWRLYRNDGDGARLHFPKEVLELERGRIYVLPPGLRFVTSCQGAVGHFFIHFNVAGLPDQALRMLFRRPRVLEGVPVLDALLNELQALLQANSPLAVGAWPARQTRDVALQWRLKAAVIEALAACVRGAPPEQAALPWQFTREVQPLVPALRFIEENLSAPLANAHLATLCGFSRDHFIRVFGAVMGQTPAAYVRERRLAQASHLLSFSRQNLEEIARATGFCDRAHLSHAFKEHTGLSPAQFRARRDDSEP